jgi:hypothetical protein
MVDILYKRSLMLYLEKVMHFHGETISSFANVRNVFGSNYLFVERLRHLPTSLWLHSFMASGINLIQSAAACLPDKDIHKRLPDLVKRGTWSVVDLPILLLSESTAMVIRVLFPLEVLFVKL